MMRSNTRNWNDYGGYTEMTAPSSNAYSTEKGRIKMYHLARRFITELFYKRRRIKNQHHQQNIIAERFRVRGQNMFHGKKHMKVRYYEKNKRIINLQLQRKCRVILTYSNVVASFETYLTLCINERA